MTSNSIKKILVVKLSSFGDLFHPLPAVRCIKEATGATIDWVTQPEYAELVQCFNDVDKVLEFPRHNFFGWLAGFLKNLRRENYDLALDFQGLLKSAITTRAAHAARRIGPSFQREGTAMFYHEIAGSRNKERHAVDECMDIVGHLGFKLLPVEFPMSFPSIPLETGTPRIALVPGTRWPSKQWPHSHFAETGRILAQKWNAALFVFGSKSEIDLCGRVSADIGGNVTDMSGKTTFQEMGSYLKGMDLVITNDSGPMHMAAALNVPVVAVFGPTDPKRTGPYGDKNITLSADVPCRPCFSRKCLENENSCMHSVTVDMVVAAAEKLLA